MVKERRWGCKKARSDVELCARDDRLCQSCYHTNGEELERANVSKGGTPTMVTRPGLVGSAANRATVAATRGGIIAARVSPSIANSTVRRESVAVAGVLPPTKSKSTKSISAARGDPAATVEASTTVGCSTVLATFRDIVAARALSSERPTAGRSHTARVCHCDCDREYSWNW